MSHNEPSPEQYREASPVRRYFDTVSIYELNDPSRASEIHERACRDLLNLFDAFAVDPLVADTVMNSILPKDYDPREFSFAEWQTQMRLVPMQLLSRGIPDSENITNDFICEVVGLTMGNCRDHGTGCLDEDVNRFSCQSSVMCPARLTRHVGLRTAALLTYSVYTYEPNPLDGFMDHQLQYQKIQSLEIALARAGLVDTHYFRAYTKNIHDHIQDEFNNDRYMTPPRDAN